MYLIDSSALITAKNHYYQFNRVPQFWEWLHHHAAHGNVKVPHEIFEEVTKQDDDLKNWIVGIKDDILVVSTDYDTRLSEVLDCYGQGEVLTPADLEKIANDPYLIACALHEKAVVVTGEVPKPTKRRANRKIPDICGDLQIEWTNVHGFEGRAGLIDLLDFKAR